MRIQEKDHPGDRNSVRLIRDMPDLCFSCHKKTKFLNKEVHAPVASGNCTGCHNPHGSAFEMILAREYPELCYACHSKEKFNKKYVHKIIMHRCSCHNPHASEHPHLLYSPVFRVCTDCHRAKQSGRHVVTSLPGAKVHPVDGVPDPRNAKKIITCTTCHNPHSSEYRNLFPKPRICKMCHKYY
jgi:predicted CXXCH cytochrome family protein